MDLDEEELGETVKDEFGMLQGIGFAKHSRNTQKKGVTKSKDGDEYMMACDFKQILMTMQAQEA